MLLITKKADYGLLFLQNLCHSEPKTFMPLRTIARQAGLPYKFLSQIAGTLKSGGIVESKEGLGGGYRLVRPPNAIFLNQVITLLDGPVAPVTCQRGQACALEPHCIHRQVMDKLSQVLEQTMAAYSLADLIKPV